jgi:hypothetical protein
VHREGFLIGPAQDVSGAYSIGFMLPAKLALGRLISNLRVLQRRTARLLPDTSR